MIKVKKGLMGGYKEDSEGSHIILSIDEYNALESENGHLKMKLNEYGNAYTKENNKYRKLSDDYSELVKKYNSIAEKARALFDKYKIQEEQLAEYERVNEELKKQNTTVYRINKEKANSIRNIGNKKGHNGYIGISGRKTRFKFNSGINIDCFLYKFQTPYNIFFSHDLAMKNIEKDFKERVLKDLDINEVELIVDIDDFFYVEEVKKKQDPADMEYENYKKEKRKEKYEYIKALCANTNKAFIFNFKLNMNMAKGFWEIIFNSKDEILINESILAVKEENKKD